MKLFDTLRSSANSLVEVAMSSLTGAPYRQDEADRLASALWRADAAERAAARNANVALLSSGLLAIGLEAALLRFFL
ncbi:MAG: hypothetical protein ACR652_00600 [Methylocystis sp.]|uniref:hypothetical protein n=1 Tax=Methylocystis sp. TaxID=1911079 RepID=UPI003DA607A0